MSESTLSISFSELQIEVGTYLGYDSDISNWSANELAEVDRFIQSGTRQFYYPVTRHNFQWSFLKFHGTLETVIGQSTYDLPDDLARVKGDLYYEKTEHRPSIIQAGENGLRAHNMVCDTTGSPDLFVSRCKTKDITIGQRFEIEFSPVPDKAYTLYYEYEMLFSKLSTSNPYPVGGMQYSELLTESCLAIAEQRSNDESGLHTQKHAQLLESLIRRDEEQGGRYLGKMGEQKQEMFSRNTKRPMLSGW